jgi:hypothetical protein
MIAKLTKKIHRMITNAITNLRRGGRSTMFALSAGLGVTVGRENSGVKVGVELAVGSGNISVIAGIGSKVVVGVRDGVADGVAVGGGVPFVAVGTGVFVRTVAVGWNCTAALALPPTAMTRNNTRIKGKKTTIRLMIVY